MARSECGIQGKI